VGTFTPEKSKKLFLVILALEQAGEDGQESNLCLGG
jgi:hypothetical protein